VSGLDELLSGPPRHLERFAPPWVKSHLTICGLQISGVASWLTFDEAKALIAEVGVTRARLLLCQTCLAQQHKMERGTMWEAKPQEIVGDWVARARWGGTPEAEETRAYLLAIGRLTAAHAEEFEAMVAAYLSDEVAARRKKKGGRQ